jgi:hypothetical protein
MTENELRLKFNTAYRIIKRERAMRDHVFRNDPAKRAEKLVEMDMLLAILTDFKDALKEHVGIQEQMALIDAPARYE